MALEDKTRVLPAGGQAPACEQLREMVSMVVQETIYAEFERFLGAAPYERTAARRGHRNGSYRRTLRRRISFSSAVACRPSTRSHWLQPRTSLQR
jgi:transposase-like protein